MKLRLAGPIIALGLAGCAETAPPQTTAADPPVVTHPEAVRRPGYATYWSGDDLWQACGRTADGEAPLACRTYVVGVSDGHNSSYARKDLRTAYCLHVEASAGDLATVVRGYLKAHPERRSRPAASLVLSALTNGYPCQGAD